MVFVCAPLDFYVEYDKIFIRAQMHKIYFIRIKNKLIFYWAAHGFCSWAHNIFHGFGIFGGTVIQKHECGKRLRVSEREGNGVEQLLREYEWSLYVNFPADGKLEESDEQMYEKNNWRKTTIAKRNRRMSEEVPEIKNA